MMCPVIGMKQMQLYLSNNCPKYLEEFAFFACHYLGINKLRGNLQITLASKNLDEEAYGLCWGDRSECEVHIANYQWGEPVDRESKLKTLAHELTHAYQYLTGHLVAYDVGDYVSRWHGADFKYKPETEHEMPWEVEAVHFEEVIYDAWMDYQAAK